MVNIIAEQLGYAFRFSSVKQLRKWAEQNNIDWYKDIIVYQDKNLVIFKKEENAVLFKTTYC